MKRIILILVFLFLISGTLQSCCQNFPVENFPERPNEKIQIIENEIIKYLFETKGGILAEERIEYKQNFKANFNKENFCKKGDVIWEYHVYHLHEFDSVSGIVFFNETNNKIYIFSFHI